MFGGERLKIPILSQWIVQTNLGCTIPKSLPDIIFLSLKKIKNYMLNQSLLLLITNLSKHDTSLIFKILDNGK